MVLEIHIEKRACDFLVANGCDVFKLGQEGVPDRLVIYSPGRCAWFEFKRPGGPLTKAQKIRIPAMRQRGHRVFLIESLAEAVSTLRVLRAEM